MSKKYAGAELTRLRLVLRVTILHIFCAGKTLRV
jgi:hypothetical protein